MDYQRMKRRERLDRLVPLGRKLFVLSGRTAISGLLVTVIGLGLGFGAHFFVVLWVGVGLLGVSILAMLVRLSIAYMMVMEIEEAKRR